ncbi:Protein phosphatase 1G [Perkinsus chesapeaki]|uniref:protein-serine/threonine phosphatase n=1 Tax=Perkinsus chesapeaki TaxID=330153 RepID=A0A7J6MTA8_PERCH|nr:Protein phosphatase 1G [Perkinsus chesapeaki]
MGASLTFLDKANTDVTTECGDWGPLSYSVSGMQGWRRSMEDDHIAHWDKNKRVGLFGVFDGHGGRGASQYVAKKIIKTILNTEAYKKNDYARALHEAFMEVDKEMATSEGAKEGVDDGEEGDEDNNSDLSDVDSSCQKEDDDVQMDVAEDDTIEDNDTSKALVDNAEDAAAGASTAPHTATSSPTNSPLEGVDEEEVEEEIDLETLPRENQHNEKHEEGEASSTGQQQQEEDQQQQQQMVWVRFVGECGEIPENEFWKMLGRQITADVQGCTAVVCALILGDGSSPPQLICANTGDSRCILARRNKAYALSDDHKPSQDTEMERIIAAGGQVEECMGQYRVQGDLNLSRALGDHRYKHDTTLPPECQIISPMPDLSKGKKRKGSPVKAGRSAAEAAAPEVGSFKQPRLNDVILHPGSEGSDSAFSLAALSGAVCQATVCPQLHLDNPNFEGNGCDNLTFMIIKIPDNIRKALPAPNPEETPEPGPPIVYGQRPRKRRNLTDTKSGVEDEEEGKENTCTERNAKRLKVADTAPPTAPTAGTDESVVNPLAGTGEGK